MTAARPRAEAMTMPDPTPWPDPTPDDGPTNYWRVKDIGLFCTKEHAGLAVRAVNAHEPMLTALSDWWAEATGYFKDKSCGHEFTCICISEKVKAAPKLARGGT